ncbi:hypothetical protein LEP1GSC047_0894 [Leptospira phage vB_LinZ_10-LE1]|nr:hypothetical protein LEP1GSC047_0894 [Leptospira phage vB_LinZ_10-LE1]
MAESKSLSHQNNILDRAPSARFTPLIEITVHFVCLPVFII